MLARSFNDVAKESNRDELADKIAKAKEKGVYTGRKRSIDAEKVKELHEQGMGATAIAKELSIGRASVYRMLSS